MENKEFVINCIDIVTGRCEGVLNDEGGLKQFGDGGTVFTEKGLKRLDREFVR